MNLSQKLSGFAKTFRSALLTRWRGFCNSAPSIGSIRRLLSCKPCQMNGKQGFFELREDLHLVSEYDECSELEHTPNQKKILRLRSDLAKEKPFKLASLMKMPKESLELEQFQSSKLKTMMWSGQLNIGEQIWIHHDPMSDPFNPLVLTNFFNYRRSTQATSERKLLKELLLAVRNQKLCLIMTTDQTVKPSATRWSSIFLNQHNQKTLQVVSKVNFQKRPSSNPG